MTGYYVARTTTPFAPLLPVVTPPTKRMFSDPRSLDAGKLKMMARSLGLNPAQQDLLPLLTKSIVAGWPTRDLKRIVEESGRRCMPRQEGVRLEGCERADLVNMLTMRLAHVL